MGSNRKHILLFEEDYDGMRDLKDHIEEALDWAVELSAEEGLLDRLRREKFDLILVDLMIHRVSLDASGREVENVHFDGVSWLRTGLEFVRRLRRGDFSDDPDVGTSPDVPVIVLSAVAASSVEEELGSESPVQGYVAKPFRLEELVKQICELLQE